MKTFNKDFSEKPADDQTSIENNVGDEQTVRNLLDLSERVENVTIHSDDESPIQEINPVEKPINVFKYQIFVRKAIMPRKLTLQPYGIRRNSCTHCILLMVI
ncbi:unnamed protein product [Acanthoscelides obtectus]|uniref:Uncharacterized protein n=1 Tax=Acanthoscelides obtectus TaxID=200917 RepID=A0A9P0L2Z0_ACAOB|nr:unnamed protein product [Acanthoscelides obtectus]CAK1679709.1 hypothetical protein AOBTE_LOCUS32416 [Acanthoscelides obtectus]